MVFGIYIYIYIYICIYIKLLDARGDKRQSLKIYEYILKTKYQKMEHQKMTVNIFTFPRLMFCF